MSSTPSYTYQSTPDDPTQELAIDQFPYYGSFNTTATESHLLSPFSNGQSLSNSVSPLQNNHSTPSGWTDAGGIGDISDLDDDFSGINFDPDLLPNLNPFHPEICEPLSKPSAAIAPSPRKASAALRKVTTQFPPSPNLTSTPSPEFLSTSQRRAADHTARYQQTAEMDFPLPHAGLDPGSREGTSQPPDIHYSRSSTDTYASMTATHRPSVLVSQWVSQDLEEPVDTNPVTNTSSRPMDPSYSGAIDSVSHESRSGLDPDMRQNCDVEILSLKQQDRQRELEQKNAEVTEWISQAGSSDSDTAATPQSYFTLAPPVQRPRAKSTSAMSPSHYPADYPADAPTEPDNVKPWTQEYTKPTENKLVEGQLYYDVKATAIKPADLAAIRQASKWDDAPRLPYITNTRTQQPTANDAMREWNTNADTFSLLSRSATWGTRRKSETNLSELTDGGLLKRLTIKDKRPRQNSIFGGIANIAARKKGDLKRSASARDHQRAVTPTPVRQNSGGLAPPPRTSSFGRSQKTPSLNSELARMAIPMASVGTSHARSGSISTADLSHATSPKSPLVDRAIGLLRRARSRSDLGRDEGDNLVNLWRGHGGPPVPALSTPASELPRQDFHRSADGEIHVADVDDDEDEDYGDDLELRVETDQSALPINPTADGFRDHIRRLNPEIQHDYLVERMVNQQAVRHKTLLQYRVNHLRDVREQACSTREFCISLGGSYVLLDKGPRRSMDANGLRITTNSSIADGNALDGILSAGSFPRGVPAPPAPRLPAQFECQLCFKVKNFQKPSDWTKHVQEDIQPFTCTYESCKESKSFKRKADWVRHENELHRHLEWWACEIDDCKHTCYRKDNFLQHLLREHKLPEPRGKSKGSMKQNQYDPENESMRLLDSCHHHTTNLPRDEPCKFCGKRFSTWKKLTVHLAKHMEDIALPILALVEQADVDHTTIISPIEQLNQVSPLTPIGMTKQSSTSSGHYNISPHTQTVPPQFGLDPAPTFFPHSGNQPLTFNSLMSMSPQDQTTFGNSIFPAYDDMGQLNGQVNATNTSLPVRHGAAQSRGYSGMPSQYAPQPAIHGYQTAQTMGPANLGRNTGLHPGPPAHLQSQMGMHGQFVYTGVPNQPDMTQPTFPNGYQDASPRFSFDGNADF